MASSRTRCRISRLGFAAASAAAGLLFANAALASQGPGGGPGTASNFTQLTMAVIVYGACALVAGAGLIGAARRHFHQGLFCLSMNFSENRCPSRIKSGTGFFGIMF